MTQPSPWLHEEIGRRMHERLEWIRLEPPTWVDWQPVRGGLQAHALVAHRYPAARCLVVEPRPAPARAAVEALGAPWWRKLGRRATEIVQVAPDGAAQMLWANMALHMEADPRALIDQWHRALATEGFLMFSCLGPDTLRELRALYGALGWPAPAHEFTDMHDWGDMLVQAGFSEPVMDMEHLTLTFETPARLLQELRGLGANLHAQRFPALRGRRWHARLEAALAEHLRGADGRLALSFEVIYGHAIKPLARPRVAEHSTLSLGDMRAMLQADKRTRD